MEALTPRIDVVCAGSPRDMGAAQGAALAARIREARRALQRLEAFRMRQPWWLPYCAYRWLAERRARRYLQEALEPALRERLDGIAQGAGLSTKALCLFNALEPLLSSVGGCTACPGACSAVAVRGKRSRTGEPIVARNFDYLPLVQPYYVLRESRPARGKRALEFTTAPLAGAVDGMNEDGLCITYNYGFTTDANAAPAPPLSMAISEALATCGTVAEAAACITSRRRWGGGLLMLADATGDIASLEISSTRSFLHRPSDGVDALFHSNAFRSESLQAVQIPWDAVYTDNAPVPLRGRRLHLSSERRDARFRTLLAGDAALGPEDLAALMSDHGDDGVPSDFTPCVHGSYWHTTACLQFLPRTRRVRVAYATACQARYEEFHC